MYLNKNRYRTLSRQKYNDCFVQKVTYCQYGKYKWDKQRLGRPQAFILYIDRQIPCGLEVRTLCRRLINYNVTWLISFIS